MTDGRLLKGRRRRRVLTDATIRVIGRSGVAGISQRVVATEAGVPASAVTYYFPTVDDLLATVLAEVNDGWVAALRRCGEDADPLGALALMIVRAGVAEARSATAAEYELCMLAGKDGRWQREYRRWSDALDAFFAGLGAGGEAVVLASAAVDGLLLRSYCHPDPPDADRVAVMLRGLVGQR